MGKQTKSTIRHNHPFETPKDIRIYEVDKLFNWVNDDMRFLTNGRNMWVGKSSLLVNRIINILTNSHTHTLCRTYFRKRFLRTREDRTDAY